MKIFIFAPIIRIYVAFSLIIFSAFFSILSHAQVEKDKVLIEIGTSTWSTLCADEMAIINDLESQGMDIAFVNYHLNDPFANEDANTRANYYNIQSVPYPIIGGLAIEPGALENYVLAYNAEIAETSAFYLSTDATFVTDSLKLSIQLFKVGLYNEDNLKVRIALCENNIAYEWLGNEVLNHVCLQMHPDADGIDVDFSVSTNINVNTSMYYPEEWDPTNMELIVFLQNDINQEIIQTQLIPLSGVFPQPVHAHFMLEDTMSCQFDAVNFSNTSTGDLQNINWYFEGGTPETSNLFEPTVVYNTAGVFDVQLIISNSISSDTLLKEDYIHVQSIPEISFSPIPMLCFNHPAYELTEGSPEEGNYYGNFVDTGYFHPSSAGVGIHSVYFYYIDPVTSCGDTLMQQAIVDLCEGITENMTIDFPFKVVFSENRLRMSFKDHTESKKYKLQIFNVSGQLMEERNINAQQNSEIFVQQACVILRIIDKEQIYLLKTCQN